MSVNTAMSEDAGLALRVRAHLCRCDSQEIPITYQALAKAMNLSPPNTIHQVTVALERLMEEDAAAGRPFIAAFVISKTRGGLPAPGFFECAQRIGRLAGNSSALRDHDFHTTELDAAVIFWRTPTETQGSRHVEL
jgi:hypothetical protein